MDFIGNRKIWYIISAAFIVIGLFSMAIRGLNWGIDFAGGTLIEYKMDQAVSTAEFMGILTDLGLEQGVTVQPSDQEGIEGILLRSPTLTPAQSQAIVDSLRAKYDGVEQLRSETVWPTIGQELRWRALLAIFAASVALVIYISFRFELKYAIASIVALLHDMLIVIGFFALFYQEINTAFVAALLTIAGYSINDSIVVFDRVRENIRYKRQKDFGALLNVSILQTLPRSIYTSLTTVICVSAIFLFGGVTIRNFMLALLVGFISGTYSSIFLASPLLATLQKMVPKFKTY